MLEETRVQYLQSRIQQLEQYHQRKDEEGKICQLEVRMSGLEIPAQQWEAKCQQPTTSGDSAPVSALRPTDQVLSVGQPKFPTAVQEEFPSFSSDEHGHHKRLISKFRPDFYMDVNKSLDKFTFREYFCENYSSAGFGANRAKLQELLLEEMKGDKITVAEDFPTCVHALGVIRKQSGAIRPITDCKRPIGRSVNCHMLSTFSTFSYLSCDDAIDLMVPGCYMSCVDLQSDYRSITIHPDDRTFCGLMWDFGEGLIPLTYNCISFGQRSAPFIFSRITDFVSRDMRRRGYNCISYLDDFFLTESTYEKCTDSMNTLLLLLRHLGFYIAYKKLSSPFKVCRFLGIELDVT